MKIFNNKKILFSLLVTLVLSCILFIPLECYAKTDTKITIGKEISNTSIDTGFQNYTFTLKSKMKVKISVTVEAVKQTIEEIDKKAYYDDEFYEDEDYYFDEFYEYENYIGFDLEDDYYNTSIEDWDISAGETKTKTVVLDAGTYTISIYGDSEGLSYTFNTEDITAYTKKISMVSKMSLFSGDSKELSVKSGEDGKQVGEILWSTSNKKIATVNSSGKVTGIKQGTCVISAKTSKSNTIKCKITIKTRPQLYITETSFDVNYVGGIEPYITFQNNFGKTIKYIYFNCYFYNTVGDPAYCSIQNTNYQRLKITGPIKNKATDTYYWDAVIYNNSVGKMYIKSAEIIFMDNKTKTISIKKSYK